MITAQNEDFQYFLSDLYRYYFGVRFSYEELLEDDRIPARFKAVIRHYLLPLVSRETTLESHLYHMLPGDPAYEIYDGLDARIRMTAPIVHRTFTGKEEILYRETIQSVKELAAVPPGEKEKKGYSLCELQIPRRKLREFVL